MKAKDCCFVEIFHFLNLTKANWLDYFDLNRSNHIFCRNSVCFISRFDKKIYIGEPDFEARKELFQIYIEKEKRPHGELDYDELSKLTKNINKKYINQKYLLFLNKINIEHFNNNSSNNNYYIYIFLILILISIFIAFQFTK